MIIRPGLPSDYTFIKSVMNEWWGGRQVDHLQHELFFNHFIDTVFVAELDNKIIGFVNGFYSQTDPQSAYIHFVGISPDSRGIGLGRKLYLQFFDKCLADGKNKVYSCTREINSGSIEFHKKLGFSFKNDGKGKVHFEKYLNGDCIGEQNETTCINCQIVHRVRDAKVVFENESILAVHDIFKPKAEMHIVVFPKEHIKSLDYALPPEGVGKRSLVVDLIETATKIARNNGYSPDGFRLVINTGIRGTQHKDSHLHIHVLGGNLTEDFS